MVCAFLIVIGIIVLIICLIGVGDYFTKPPPTYKIVTYFDGYRVEELSMWGVGYDTYTTKFNTVEDAKEYIERLKKNDKVVYSVD